MYVLRPFITVCWTVLHFTSPTSAEDLEPYRLLEPLLGQQVEKLPLMRPLNVDDPHYLALIELLEKPFNQ